MNRPVGTKFIVGGGDETQSKLGEKKGRPGVFGASGGLPGVRGFADIALLNRWKSEICHLKKQRIAPNGSLSAKIVKTALQFHEYTDYVLIA